MKIDDIIQLRLRNQHLLGQGFASPEEVVAHFGAIQCQDFAAAKWSVGLRMRQATDEIIEKAFNEGNILRTHVMRPTWHFVMPEDIRWMLDLTAPRVRKILAPYDKRLEIDAAFLARCKKLVGQALEGRSYLTRAELGQYLGQHGIEARGQRLGHIMAHMELDALVCSGPRRGKQMTYALLEERALKVPVLTREQALARLALKYFASHGPAQLKDFAWWSGLSVKDAVEGLDLAKPELDSESIEGKVYHFRSPDKSGKSKSTAARLLSIYDEYTIAYKDRAALSEGREKDIETLLSMGNALTAVIIINGKLAGTWKRTIKKDSLEIKLNPFRKLRVAEEEAIQAEVDRYGKFWNIPAILAY